MIHLASFIQKHLHFISKIKLFLEIYRGHLYIFSEKQK